MTSSPGDDRYTRDSRHPAVAGAGPLFATRYDFTPWQYPLVLAKETTHSKIGKLHFNFRICTCAGMSGAEPLLIPRSSRHERVECRPKLPAVMILFLKDLVLGACKYEVAAGEQILPKRLNGWRGDDFVAASRDH
jgi:hypothetical protein